MCRQLLTIGLNAWIDAPTQLIQTHLKEMFSVIYTPTEGDAIQNYSRLFRRPEGCFLNIKDQDRIEECLCNFGRGIDVDYIVVSDGEEVRNIFLFVPKSNSHAFNCRYWASETKVSDPY